nr:proline-rich protein 36-like [Aegilops tauschii subsp. strangulata]
MPRQSAFAAAAASEFHGIALRSRPLLQLAPSPFASRRRHLGSPPLSSPVSTPCPSLLLHRNRRFHAHPPDTIYLPRSPRSRRPDLVRRPPELQSTGLCTASSPPLQSPPSSTETTLDLATLRRISPTSPPPPRTTGAAAPSTPEPPLSVAVVATLAPPVCLTLTLLRTLRLPRGAPPLARASTRPWLHPGAPRRRAPLRHPRPSCCLIPRAGSPSDLVRRLPASRSRVGRLHAPALGCPYAAPGSRRHPLHASGGLPAPLAAPTLHRPQPAARTSRLLPCAPRVAASAPTSLELGPSGSACAGPGSGLRTRRLLASRAAGPASALAGCWPPAPGPAPAPAGLLLQPAAGFRPLPGLPASAATRTPAAAALLLPTA